MMPNSPATIPIQSTGRKLRGNHWIGSTPLRRECHRCFSCWLNFGKEGQPEQVIPKISQETPAEIMGTIRSRLDFFMNKFRKLGLIA